MLMVVEGYEVFQVVVGVLDGLDDLIKMVGFCDFNGWLLCIIVLGLVLWDCFQIGKCLKELWFFVFIEGVKYIVFVMFGDLFFYICVECEDFCFEFECLLLD